MIYLANPDFLKEQGENGYTSAKAHFDRTTLATKYIDHLTKL